MSAAVMMVPTPEASPRLNARIAGIFYLLNIVSGSLALFFMARKLPAMADTVNIVATISYLVVTLLLYELFKPVNQRIALIAAMFSIIGCAPLRILHIPVNALGFFGFYCLLTGYLIVKSTFLPRILGVAVAIGGLGWLTFLSPSLSHSLYPYNMVPGVLAETAFTVWLLAVGVDARRWNETAALAGGSR